MFWEAIKKVKRKFEEPYGVFYHLLKQDIKHVESLPFVFNPNVMEGPQASWIDNELP